MKKREMKAEINRLENTIGYLSVSLEEQRNEIEHWQTAYEDKCREAKKWSDAAADYLAEREEARRWARWYKKNYDGLRAYALKCDPLKSWAEKHGIDLTR